MWEYNEDGSQRWRTFPNGSVIYQDWDPNANYGEGGYKTIQELPPPPRGAAGPSGVTVAVGASTIADRAADNARADEKLAFEKEQAALKEALRQSEAQAKDAERKAAEAREQRNFDAEQYWLNVRDTYLRDRDKKKDEADRKAIERQDRLDKQAADIQRGYIDGMPTLTREQWEAEQANQPGNYYNYAFNSRGETPPARPGMPAVTGGTAPAVPVGSTTAATRDISNWRNMDIPTILATFSATELARLPLEALAQLPNEELLRIGAESPGGVDEFLRLFPGDRLSTFGEDVQARVRGGAPADIPVTDQTPGSVLPIGGVGGARTMPGVTPEAQQPELPPVSPQDAGGIVNPNMTFGALQNQGFVFDEATGVMRGQTPGAEPSRRLSSVPQQESGITVNPDMTLPALQKQGWSFDDTAGVLRSPAAPAGGDVASATNFPDRTNRKSIGLVRPAGWKPDPTLPGVIGSDGGVPALKQGGKTAPLIPAIRNPIQGLDIPTYRSQGNMPAFSAQTRSRMSPSERQVLDVTINRTGGRAEDAAWRDQQLTSGGASSAGRRYRGMPGVRR